MLQPKWDGFRCLIEVAPDGRWRAWSRHGVSLADRIGPLLESCPPLPAETVIDAELVAVSERGGRVVQDFAAVRQAVFVADRSAAARLRLVAFDLLVLGGDDLRGRPWRERDALLRETVPECVAIRLIESVPADLATHEALVKLGFEGSVLKRPRSTYRSGRQRGWRKLKARHRTSATMLEVRRSRDDQTFAVCDTDGKRVIALAPRDAAAMVGETVQIVYSRVDADGSLREARIAPRSASERLNGGPALSRAGSIGGPAERA